MASWKRLSAYLRDAGRDVRLTWDQLDEIVGGVPPSAANHLPWWHGDRSHVRAWRDAGFAATNIRLGKEVTFVLTGSSSEVVRAVADSYEQRAAEVHMLERLGAEVGRALRPKRLTSPSGSYIDVDGVSEDGLVLAECWAHQGPSKVAQKYKLVNDATKLHWAASWLDPTPARLIICVSDEAAVKHLRGKSWQGQAISALGVEIIVVELAEEVVATVISAQRRQVR